MNKMTIDEYLAATGQSKPRKPFKTSGKPAKVLFEVHEPCDQTITLPLPPSANHHWRMVLIDKSPRMLLSSEGRKYRVAVAAAVAREWPLWKSLAGRIRLEITVHARDARKIDISNRIKALEDALTKAKVWNDDEQVDLLIVHRGAISRPDGFVQVRISTIDTGD